MKQSAFTTAVIMLLASCSFHNERGSGNIITEKRNLSPFTGIEASASVDVEVKIGAPEVEVEADDNIMRYVETRVSGNTLHVGFESGTSVSNAHVKVYVTVPEISRVEANSAASVKVIDLVKSNGNISFVASSSGDVEAEVDAPEVKASASSAGTVTLSGKTRNYRVNASSSGDVKSFDLLSENTDVHVNSSGSADVYASVSLAADASSGGDVDYRGGATVKVNTNSGGSVTKKD